MTERKKRTKPKISYEKRGRPRINHEFRDARMLVRQEQLGSVQQFHKWWALNTPGKIPKRPDRAYKNEWQGWPDFLGVYNEYPCIKRKFRSFNESRAFAQQQGFNTKSEWLEFAKSGEKPKDVPSRPDIVYREEWFTWKDFLGADVASVKRNIDTAKAIFFIISRHGRPSNVYQFGITLEGLQTILDAQRNQGFKIIDLFHCDITFNWKGFAEDHGRNYWEGGTEDEYIVPNISDFIFQVSDFVEPVRKR